MSFKVSGFFLTAVAVGVFTLNSAATAQGTDRHNTKPGELPSKSADRSEGRKPKPMKPRSRWRNFWHDAKSIDATDTNFAISCKKSAEGSLEVSSAGVVNRGQSVEPFSCRGSLPDVGAHYQLSILTDHTHSVPFDCAAGPIHAERKYPTNAAADTSSSETTTNDRDEWIFVASRRLKTLELRCLIPSGGSIREVQLSKCRGAMCLTNPVRPVGNSLPPRGPKPKGI